MIFLILFLVLFSTPSYADTYAVQRDDGGVSIVNYFEGSNDSLSDVLKSMGFSRKPIQRVNPSELPSRSDRRYWKFNNVPIGNPVVLDTVKKNADEAKALADENRRKALANKMGLTDSEYQEAKDLRLIHVGK